MNRLIFFIGIVFTLVIKISIAQPNVISALQEWEADRGTFELFVDLNKDSAP